MAAKGPARTDHRKLYRYIVGLVLIVAAIGLLFSLASRDALDPPADASPRNEVVQNLCGIVGAYVAFALHWVFGSGSYIFAIVMAGIGLLLISEKNVEDRVVRVIGIVVILVTWCASMPLLLGPDGMPGGFMGQFIHGHLFAAIGAGAYLIVFVGFAAGALLAADAFVFWMGRKSAQLVTLYVEHRQTVKAGDEKGEKVGPKAKGADADDEPMLRKTDPDERLAAQKELLRQRIAERKSAAQTESAAPLIGMGERAEQEAFTIASRRGAERKRPSAKAHVAREYRLPPLDLLDPVSTPPSAAGDEHVEEKRQVLERTLEEFGIAAQVVEIDRGPVITQFEIELAPGVKITKVASLSDDIARAMKAQSVRIVAPIPGKSTVGVEVPNQNREMVRLRELFESGVLARHRMHLPLLLGKNASGDPLVSDLAQSPHLLVAGATGSGKSVCINSIIMTLIMTQHPDDLKLLLIDPKMVELSVFRDVPHLMAPVLTDMKKAAAVLEWATRKMDERYSLLANVGARNINAYNALGADGIRKRLGLEPDEEIDEVPFHMPYIVIIVDELADMMMIAAKEIENSITRLAQKSRAVGLHLIVATQRPSVDVVTGLIKANLPSRLAFQTSSKVDSRTILDRNGAEKLLGQGDMLFLPPGTSQLIRAQGSYTSDDEIRRVVKFITNMARPKFATELVNPKGLDGEAPSDRDDLFDEALRIVLESQRGSVSLLQRKLGIGYSRSARLVDMMAEVGIVGDYKGSQAREVLYTLEQWEAAKGDADDAGA